MFQRLICPLLLIFFCILLCSSSVLSQDQNKLSGIRYINEGKYRPAIEEFEKVILKNPRDAEALFYLGVAYRNLGSGQLKNALSGISQALKIRPNDPNWQYALAQTYDDMDKFGVTLTDTNKTTYELGVEAYKKAIALQDGFKEAHLSLGELYLRRGKYELAAEKFKDVIKIDPQNESSYSYLADCLCKLDRYDEAISNLNKWCNINVNKIEPHNLKAKIYWYQGKYEEAQREYQKIIELDPSNQLARAKLDTIIIINQNKSRINEFLTRGEALFNARQYEQSIVQYEEIRRIDPNHSIANERLREARTRLSDYFFNLGLERVRNNDLERAVENFNRALQYAQSRNQMNTIIQSWQQAQITLGEKAQIYKLRQRGENYILEKDYSLAKEYLNIFYRESGTSESKVKIALDTLEIAALYKVASEKERDGDWVGALTFYSELFKNDSTYKDIKFRIAKVNGDLACKYKKWDDAEEYYLKAIQINATNANLKEYPDSTSVVEKLRETFLSQKNEKALSLLIYLVSAILFCFLGIGMGILGHSLYIKNRDKFLGLINDVISFFTFKNISVIIVCFILIFLIYYFRNDFDYLLSKTNSTLRSLIYWVVIAIILVLFLILLPKSIPTNFQITSDQVTFNVPYSKNNPSVSFSLPLNSKQIELKKVKKIFIRAKLFKINDCSLFNNEIIIEPFNNATDFDVQVHPKSKSSIRIKNFSLKSNNEFTVQKRSDDIIIFFGCGAMSRKNDIEQTNCIKIEEEFCLILSKCRIVSNGTAFEIKSTKKCNIILDEQKDQGIIFDTVNNSSEISIRLEKELLGIPISLFKDLNGKEIKFFDKFIFQRSNCKISTIQTGTYEILLKGKKPEAIDKAKFIIFRPEKFEKLDLTILPSGILSVFNAKIKLLKCGDAHTLSDKPNEIPVFLEWFWEFKRVWALFLLFIGWATVFIFQPYLESLFSKIP